jgi:hypothetical protein
MLRRSPPLCSPPLLAQAIPAREPDAAADRDLVARRTTEHISEYTRGTDGKWEEEVNWKGGVPCADQTAMLPTAAADFAVTTTAGIAHPLGMLVMSQGTGVVFELDSAIDFGAPGDAECHSVSIPTEQPPTTLPPQTGNVTVTAPPGLDLDPGSQGNKSKGLDSAITNSTKPKNDLPTGALVGIGVAGLLVLAAGFVFVFKLRKSRKQFISGRNPGPPNVGISNPSYVGGDGGESSNKVQHQDDPDYIEVVESKS